MLNVEPKRVQEVFRGVLFNHTRLGMCRNSAALGFLLTPCVQGAKDAERFRAFVHKLRKNCWAGVIDLPENTILLLPVQGEDQDRLLFAILLTKMSARKMDEAGMQFTTPCTAAQALSSPATLSYKYWQEGEVKFEECLENGFYDPGRVSGFLALEEYRKQCVSADREVLLLDSAKVRVRVL